MSSRKPQFTYSADILHPRRTKRATCFRANTPGLMIATEAMVAEAPKKDEPMPGGGGMGGMGDMM